MKTAEEKRRGIAHSNEVVMDSILGTLQHGQFTGQIVLHIKDGVIRKHERRDIVTTDELLTEARSQQ